MNELQKRFVHFVRARRLVADGHTVLVAVSGGVDSVVLLHLFQSAASALGIDLHAAHFDHAMRPDSAADAAWVLQLCEAWRIPLISRRAQHSISGETAARKERYQFFQRAMNATGATRVATAHHADDQIETVLFRLLRGTGLRGLAGIPLRRGSFIRPLLRFRKTDLLAYAEAEGLEHRHDASNDQLEYARNRIRREVIPAIETVRADAGKCILKLARYAARTEAAWRCTLERMERPLIVNGDTRFTELARPILLEYDPELRVRVMRHVLRRYGVVPGRAGMRQLLAFCENARSGAALSVAGHVKIERVFDRIRIARVSRQVAPDERVTVVGNSGSARLILGGCVYAVEWKTGDVRPSAAGHFDLAILAYDPVMRAWQPGDRIALPYGTKKLKKLFAERRIAVPDRDRIPILADTQGRVLWVAGVARSVHALPSDTGPALNITVSNADSR